MPCRCPTTASGSGREEGKCGGGLGHRLSREGGDAKSLQLGVWQTGAYDKKAIKQDNSFFFCRCLLISLDLVVRKKCISLDSMK